MSEGKSLTFSTLFTEVERVEVPIVQRDYAQGRTSASDVRRQFLRTIQSTLLLDEDQLSQPLDLDFVYGSFIADSEKVFSVLDGQQRLTTLFLLHWYLAVQDDQLEDFHSCFVKDKYSRFTYKTRHSSAEFFDALCTANPVFAGLKGALSKQIVDSQWFFLSWQQDPTIQSCLVMLDEIHKLFCDSSGLYRKLVNDETPYITFQYLNLEEFGLSDDLYIKMNARGKPLTAFENFKAWLFGSIHDQDFAAEFECNVDQQWSDVFWQLGQSAGKDFDTLFLRFFYLMAFFDASQKAGGSSAVNDSDTRDWLQLLRKAHGFVSLQGLEERDAFNPQVLEQVSAFLEFYRLQAKNEQKALFASVLGSDDNFVVQARFYALVLFVLKAPAADSWDESNHEQLRCWLRVSNNLINNARVDELRTFLSAANDLVSLSKHSAVIYEFLSTAKRQDIGFAASQAKEEILKAKLVLESDIWEPLFIKYEDHDYLKGKVGFLLAYSLAGDDIYDPKLFESYAQKTHVLLSQEMLRSEDFLLQRALLTQGDYLLWKGGEKYSFGLPNQNTFRERDENWLSVVSKPVFKQLLDLISGEVKAALQNIIEAVSCGGWQQKLVEYPQAIAYCKHQKLHIEDNSIYLLSKSRLSGYYVELTTYAFYIDLKKLEDEGKLPSFIESVSYEDTYGDDFPGVYLVRPGKTSVCLCYNGDSYVVYEYDEDKGEYGEAKSVPKKLASYLNLPVAEEDTA